MSIRIQGWGTALPDHFVTQEEAARVAVELWGACLPRVAVLPALYRRSGVQTRYSVLLEPTTTPDSAQYSFFSPAKHPTDKGPTTAERLKVFESAATTLATAACEAALADAGVDASQIDHLIVVSCTGFSAPGVDLGLIDVLGLKRDVTRTQVGFMGCHGALNGLRIARSLVAQNPACKVLMCCVELCSLHQQYTSDTQQLVANSLFSDGSAAVVVGGDATNAGSWGLRDNGSWVLPETKQMMSWRIGDHGFEMTLSPEVPGIIQATLRPWLTNWLSRNGRSLEEIKAWAIHPGGPRILTACGEALQIDPTELKPSQEILAACGNMSSPTILFILDRLRREENKRPCVALAFGPGLAIEAALFD